MTVNSEQDARTRLNPQSEGESILFPGATPKG